MAATVIDFPRSLKTDTYRRKTNKELRPREYLTPSEVVKMVLAARTSGSRTALRDSLIRETARHGLRAAELVRLRWDHFNFTDDTVHVERVKHGSSSTHYLERPLDLSRCRVK